MLAWYNSLSDTEPWTLASRKATPTYSTLGSGTEMRVNIQRMCVSVRYGRNACVTQNACELTCLCHRCSNLGMKLSISYCHEQCSNVIPEITWSFLQEISMAKEDLQSGKRILDVCVSLDLSPQEIVGQ